MKVLLLSRYAACGASSRVRLLQYLPHMIAKGWQVDLHPFFSDGYLQALYARKARRSSVVSAYRRRVRSLVRFATYDLIWLEKEVFPFLPAVAEHFCNLVGVPYVVDYDDALFHRYDRHPHGFIRAVLGGKIDAVMRNAALVVAGNRYLADRARRAGARRVEVVPSVVNLDRYPLAPAAEKDCPIVGWIGSPATSHYLESVTAVAETLKAALGARFVAIGAEKTKTAKGPFEVWPWEEEKEVQALQQIDVGVMPLLDSPWERGKCGYKLIQYMACGKPVVASPVGVNQELVEHGANGFLARTDDEWRAALRRLLTDSSKRRAMGRKGRKKVEADFTLQRTAPILIDLFEQVQRGAG